MQVDSSTTFNSLIINESTVIYLTIRTNPNNSTTITTISNVTKRIRSIVYTKCLVICEIGIPNCTIITVPVNCTTRTSSSVINECYILNKTIMSTFIPINSTTISTSSIIFKVRISEISILTVARRTSLQVNCSTTFSSLIINESTVIYLSVRTDPNNSTTITTISNVTKRIRSIVYSECLIIGEVGMLDFTRMTIPIYSPTGTFSSVLFENCIMYPTILSTFMPINSTTIGTCSVIYKVNIFK